MRSVNKVILIGNLTRDPSIKTTPNGRTVVTFTLATNREWVSNGERQSLAEFHNVAVWGRLAEVCEKFLKKGKLVYVEGYLKTRSWDTPEGGRLFRTEIVAYDMIMLNKRGDSEMSLVDDSDSGVHDEVPFDSLEETGGTESSETSSSEGSVASEEFDALESSLDGISDNSENLK
jgi:single-strand DNA-binding protein